MKCPPWLPQRRLKPALAHSLPCFPPQGSDPKETCRYHSDYSANVAEPGLNAPFSEVREKSQQLLARTRSHHSAALSLANFGIEGHWQFVARGASLVQMSASRTRGPLNRHSREFAQRNVVSIAPYHCKEPMAGCIVPK